MAGTTRAILRVHAYAPWVLGNESFGARIEDETERRKLRVRAGECAVHGLAAEDEVFLRGVDDGAATLEDAET